VHNPYYELYLEPGADRDKLVRQFAWSIPDETSINLIAEYAPIVEIGAGVGYWAWLLRRKDVDVVAYDSHPTSQTHNRYHHENPQWTEVLRGNASDAAKHPRHALLLCWPPVGEPMASDALAAYQGNHVIHIGASGITGDHAFHRELIDSFTPVETHVPPRWPNVHDVLVVWRRKKLRIFT